MADADRDGKLCRHEFGVAMHLAALAVQKDGLPLPATLPPCLASATAVVAATAWDEGGEDEEKEVEGRVILVDDAKSVVSSLGYPEGLSDVGSDQGDAIGGTSDNTTGKQNSSRKMSQAVSASFRESDAPGQKRDTPKAGDEGLRHVGATAARSKTGAKTKREREHGEQAGMQKQEEDDLRYAMSDRETVRFGKAFDKLVKGKATKNLGGKEVRISMCSCKLGHDSLRTCLNSSELGDKTTHIQPGARTDPCTCSHIKARCKARQYIVLIESPPLTFRGRQQRFSPSPDWRKRRWAACGPYRTLIGTVRCLRWSSLLPCTSPHARRPKASRCLVSCLTASPIYSQRRPERSDPCQRGTVVVGRGKAHEQSRKVTRTQERLERRSY